MACFSLFEEGSLFTFEPVNVEDKSVKEREESEDDETETVERREEAQELGPQEGMRFLFAQIVVDVSRGIKL